MDYKTLKKRCKEGSAVYGHALEEYQALQKKQTLDPAEKRLLYYLEEGIRAEKKIFDFVYREFGTYARVILFLYLVKGYSINEIAESNNVPSKKLRSDVDMWLKTAFERTGYGSTDR